ncbi:MAG TPA: hypothetical protein VF503_01190 [Sphingobium sp.]|uniref:hypothetical protein n=1 Tax=Sphingobium sp. TaxID=1912891 RepID=UPI002ED67CF2
MKSLPQALHDRAELLARAHPLQTVAALLGLNPSQISRMKKRGWRAPPDGRRRRPMPQDFAIRSRTMSHNELVAHYRAGNSTVHRWFAELTFRRPSMKGDNLRSRGAQRTVA